VKTSGKHRVVASDKSLGVDGLVLCCEYIVLVLRIRTT